MFDELKEKLETRQVDDWPLVKGIGDILFEFFDLDGPKGQQFQQQVSEWVAKDTDATKEIKKFTDLPGDVLGMQKAIDEAQNDPRLRKLTFHNIMTVIFQTMPRYPMLLTQLIKYTDESKWNILRFRKKSGFKKTHKQFSWKKSKFLKANISYFQGKFKNFGFSRKKSKITVAYG